MIEAGLGGRFDATNVIPSKVQVLTSVSLEHTRWLGPTLSDIAREKLDVVHDHGTLVVGDLDPESLAVAERVAAERHAAAGAPPSRSRLPLRAAGGFQHVNFAPRGGGGRGLPRAAARRRGGRERRGRDRRARPARAVGRAPAHAPRRRPQPVRSARAGRLAAGRARRAPPARGGDRRARGQGRRRHARARCCRTSTAWCSRARMNPRSLSPGHARDARGEARRPAGGDGGRAARRARRARASWPGRTAPWSPPARST